MRLFVTFKPTTMAKDKVMVFNGLTVNQVQDHMVTYYKDTWLRIYTEPEISKLLPQLYECKDNWIKFGTAIDYSVSVNPITKWFRIAKPEPKDKDRSTQLGVVLEEVTELLDVFRSKDEDTNLQELFDNAYLSLSLLSKGLYKSSKLPDLNQEDKINLLDALADITVTTIGSAYTYGMDMDKALTEVNRSNFSKYEDGKPIFNEHGKMIKGKNYTKPNLGEFV